MARASKYCNCLPLQFTSNDDGPLLGGRGDVYAIRSGEFIWTLAIIVKQTQPSKCCLHWGIKLQLSYANSGKRVIWNYWKMSSYSGGSWQFVTLRAYWIFAQLLYVVEHITEFPQSNQEVNPPFLERKSHHPFSLSLMEISEIDRFVLFFTVPAQSFSPWMDKFPWFKITFEIASIGVSGRHLPWWVCYTCERWTSGKWQR